MRDRMAIVAGLALFLVVATFPVWYNVGAGTTSKAPDPKLPANENRCVAAVDYMRTSHMDLLAVWREDVVRGSRRTFVSSDGTTYTMSLTQTCLKCHGAKADFCDRCHNYAGVQPHCWDCHIERATQGSGA